MKNLIKFFCVPILFSFLVSCGSATEVGNPTIPVIITGVLDMSTIPDVDISKSPNSNENESAILSDYAVYALATDGTSAEEPVESTGLFALEVYEEKTYEFSVLKNEIFFAYFSFEENDAGGRGNTLTVRAGAPDINMGQIRYENGAFYPENEPRRQMQRNGQ